MLMLLLLLSLSLSLGLSLSLSHLNLSLLLPNPLHMSFGSLMPFYLFLFFPLTFESRQFFRSVTLTLRELSMSVMRRNHDT